MYVRAPHATCRTFSSSSSSGNIIEEAGSGRAFEMLEKEGAKEIDSELERNGVRFHRRRRVPPALNSRLFVLHCYRHGVTHLAFLSWQAERQAHFFSPLHDALLLPRRNPRQGLRQGPPAGTSGRGLRQESPSGAPTLSFRLDFCGADACERHRFFVKTLLVQRSLNPLPVCPYRRSRA